MEDSELLTILHIYNPWWIGKKTDNAEQETRRMANIYGSISADVNATKQEIKTPLDQLPARMAESLTKHLRN